jgi:hypothetical protein
VELVLTLDEAVDRLSAFGVSRELQVRLLLS